MHRTTLLKRLSQTGRLLVVECTFEIVAKDQQRSLAMPNWGALVQGEYDVGTQFHRQGRKQASTEREERVTRASRMRSM